MRWHCAAMEADPDMVALRASATLVRFFFVCCFCLLASPPLQANGAKMERDASGHFPPFVVKEVDVALVEKTRPGVSFANVAGVEEGPLTVFLSPNDEPGWVRSEQRSPALSSVDAGYRIRRQ